MATQGMNDTDPAVRDETWSVLLAGGFGTRIAHLLPDSPKPMARVAGRPFLEWVIRLHASFGLRRFLLSTGHQAGVIEDHFRRETVRGCEIRCCRESRPLGTAGAFLEAMSTLPVDAPAYAGNGDSLVLADPTTLRSSAMSEGWDVALFGIHMPDTSRYGSLVVRGDRTLAGFAEKQPGSGLVNGGVYWVSARARSAAGSERPLSFERQLFPEWIRQGIRIGVVPISVPFIDIGTPATLAAADRFVRDCVVDRLGGLEDGG